MKRKGKILLWTLVIIAGTWTLLTLWVEVQGPGKKWELSAEGSVKKALIVYDPDPIYNLDEQVCRSFGKGLAHSGIATTIASVRAAKDINVENYDLYVFCSNTYNWRPDWAITSFIERRGPWRSAPVAAVTLGSGSTEASQEYFEKIVTDYQGVIISSKSLWLMRPNDESRIKESNIQLADSLAYKWGVEVAGKITAQTGI